MSTGTSNRPTWYLVREHEISTEYAGTTLGEYYTDPDVFLQTEIKASAKFFELYGYGPARLTEIGINPFFYTVAGLLGAKLVFPPDASAQIEGRVVKKLSDIRNLEVPTDVASAGYIPALIQKFEYLRAKAEITGITPVFSLANQSPLGTATVLRGTEIFTDIIEQPGAVKDLLEIITETAIRAIGFQEKFTGRIPENIGMDDDYGGLYHPDLYEEFNLPYIKRVLYNREYKERALHTETFSIDHLRFIEELDITHYDAWPYHGMEVEDVLAALPKRYFTWNIATAKDLYTYTAEGIAEEYARLVDLGAPGIVLNLCARGVPRQIIRAFVDTAREFDRRTP